MTTNLGLNGTILQNLQWRYATKKFDPKRRISSSDWSTLEDALVLTPSSFGLQPWKFIVITDPKVKSELKPVSWNQQQFIDCSHVVVFAIRKNMGKPEIEAHLRHVAEVRALSLESLDAYRQMMVSNLVEGPISLNINFWAARQAYIALGNFLTCAAMLHIDACPIEGFEPAKYDQILGLSKQNLASVVVAVAGYRAKDDKYAELPKVRFDRENLIERI